MAIPPSRCAALSAPRAESWPLSLCSTRRAASRVPGQLNASGPTSESFLLGLDASPAPVDLGRLPTVRGMADTTISGRGLERAHYRRVLLDGIWALLCEQHPTVHGVKIDVQGMELAVLEGMRATLTLHRPKLILEFHSGVDRRSYIRTFFATCGITTLRGRDLSTEIAEVGPVSYADDKSYTFRRQPPGY